MWKNNILVVYCTLAFHLLLLPLVLTFLDKRSRRDKRALSNGEIDFHDAERFAVDSLDSDVLDEARRVRSLTHERASDELPPLLVDSIVKTFPVADNKVVEEHKLPPAPAAAEIDKNKTSHNSDEERHFVIAEGKVRQSGQNVRAAVNNVSLAVEKGEIFALLGANGAGI